MTAVAQELLERASKLHGGFYGLFLLRLQDALTECERHELEARRLAHPVLAEVPTGVSAIGTFTRPVPPAGMTATEMAAAGCRV